MVAASEKDCGQWGLQPGALLAAMRRRQGLKIAVQLSHQNISQVFDLGKHEGRYFLVMEFIDGYDLSRLQEICCEKDLAAPLDVLAFVGREICAGLHYAHNRRDRSGKPLDLIHRDVSPQNILLSFDGEVKLIDFGIAKVSTRLQQTHAGVIKGKFYYMSPEQAGAHDVDQRSDIFSLGICLWESACGRSLFRREGGPSNPLAILHEIRTLPIPRVRELRRECPRELDEIIATALSRDLTRRYQTGAEMQAALSRYIMNHAPHYDRSRLANFMVDAFEKEETSKEFDRVQTNVQQLMTRSEFQPSDKSVIFAIADWEAGADPAAALLRDPPTNIRNSDDTMPPRSRTVEAQLAPISGVTDAKVDDAIRTTDRSVPEVTEGEMAMSETVFIQKDEIQAMKDAGTAPEVVSHQEEVDTDPGMRKLEANPNSRTQALPSDEIQAVHRAYSAHLQSITDEPAMDESELPPLPTPTYASHPLFRVLVIAVLILSILSATLWLLLIRRSRDYERLVEERQEYIKKESAEAFSQTTSANKKP